MAADGVGGGPARRPRGRRTQILAAAAEQFHRRGYHQVAMAEVAAAVGITAPALYRHYRGKPELLRQAVRGGLGELAAAVAVAEAARGGAGQTGAAQVGAARGGAGRGGPAVLAEALAAVALDERALATLWQRDARLLPPPSRAELRRALRASVRAASRIIAADRPELSSQQCELLVWSALSVAGSLSYHTFAPPRRRFERLMAELLSEVLLSEVLRVEVSGDPSVQLRGAETAPSGVAAAPGRREELLAAAVRLFDERGFDNVSTDRLGAAVGIAGPSLYKHFPAKGDLLAAALVRCRERLWHEVAPVLLAAGEPAAALDRGLCAYVAFACRHHHYLGAMVSETERLAEPDRKAALDFRRDFLRLWVELLRQVRPADDKAEARIRVHAMFALVNDGVRNGSRAPGAELAPLLHRLAHAVLGTAGGTAGGTAEGTVEGAAEGTAEGAGPAPGPPLRQRSALPAVAG
ncbi:TetR family transcriptional regulator [Kitasatospora sp. NBC_01287]|uniref:TetR/AcrR family transcriptional regulator n=1 Tax=Kitasatospora sp. NBC_01287 TaxID=2903573 RepID=UPI00224D9E2A|nr:TetR/AcrR family transcriptional regulator [Kitasatospora sp. NBC_01287]MCX4748182.1 TetR family transcriptional regulator [Kitasatospora sp. NBC_01287]